MNGKCFDIGVIQAFLDGETAAELTARVTEHVSICDSCAAKLAEADEENSIVFSALDREFNTLVPTQRLWTRINDTIAVEKTQLSVWQRILSALPLFQLSSPTFAAICGVVMLVSLFAVFNGIRNRSNEEIAGVPQPSASQNAPASAVLPALVPDTVVASDPDDASLRPTATQVAAKDSVKESNISPERIRSVVNAEFTARRDAVRDAKTVEAAYLPGEESYMKTISNLKQSVDDQKDRVLTPSTRVAYERDMAVVNDSIKRMQSVVRKNPRNQAAKQVLYAAYQDKIDLLNSVAQREELMASLR
jgi:hypothetical protein